MAKLKIKTKKELKQRNLQAEPPKALAVQRWYREYVARRRSIASEMPPSAAGWSSWYAVRKQMRYEGEQAAKIMPVPRAPCAPTG